MTRPTLREPHPVRAGAVLCGALAAGGWLVAFGLLSVTSDGYPRWFLIGGGLAWLASFVLVKAGDRGVAAGVAAATGVAWAVAVPRAVADWVNSGV